jgi:peptidoglycan/xylan/chitin deacetylase (PgdA/CDA1 family)
LSASAATPLVLGWFATVLAGKKRRGQNYGILYHSITSGRPRTLSQISTERFSVFLRRLQANSIRTCSVREWIRNQEKDEKSSTPVRLLPLAFDDGFGDVYENAVPVLLELGMSATFYPVAGFLGRLSQWDPLARLPHLTREQLREIADLGMEIGSHTLTHPDLRMLHPQKRRRELKESKEILEDICGVSVSSLSFPFGSWDREVLHLSQELGYTSTAVYGGAPSLKPPLIPLTGMYAFDTVDDMCEKACSTTHFSTARARAFILPHFAKGAPLWRFRSDYRA